MLLLFVIIATVSIQPLVEDFTPITGPIVLLGDSIFRNDAYVPNGKSVCDLLREKTNVKCLAQDHATISDVYGQIEQIPIVPEATAFLSVGGNDILSHYAYTNHDVTDLSFVAETFRNYTTLATHLEQTFPQMHIVLVDLYFPAEDVYSSYAPIIREWNRCMYEWAGKKQWKVLKVSQLLREPEDFAYGVEPSSTGTQKIVAAITGSPL
jgi:hypothetical protein